MTKHAIERLKERHNIDIKYFNKYYSKAIKKNLYFKDNYQSPFNKDSLNIIIKINYRLLGITLDKRTGKIITFYKLKSSHFKEAEKRGIV